MIASVTILSLAVLVALSRNTWASAFAARVVFAFITGSVKVRRGAVFVLALAVPLLLLWKLSPDVWNYLLNARVGRLTEIFASPDVATSGRFDTWSRVLTIVADNLQYLAFGIGYKTLTFARLFHGEIIVDNGYLSLLLETGLAGLTVSFIFSRAILKSFFKLLHAKDQALAFWSAALFSLSCGQLVQMLAVDAYTYWRNMVIFAALATFTLNRAARVNSLDGAHGSVPRTMFSGGRFR